MSSSSGGGGGVGGSGGGTLGRPWRRASFSVQASVRRSSLSARDLALISQAVQDHARASSRWQTILWWAFVFTFSLLYLNAVFLHRGLFPIPLWHLFTSPLRLIPSLWDPVALTIVVLLVSLQIFFHNFVPSDRVVALEQTCYVNGLVSCSLLCLLYVAGATLHVFRGTLLLDHMPSILFYLFLLACLLGLVIAIQAHYDSSGYGMDSFSDIWHGVAVSVRIVNMDVGYFVRTRVYLSIWALSIVSSCYRVAATPRGLDRTWLIATTLQSLSLIQALWHERTWLSGSESRRETVGLQRLLTYCVFLPMLAATPNALLDHAYLVAPLSAISTVVLILLGSAVILIGADADRQRIDFRLAKGNIKIWGRDPYFISAKYRSATGDSDYSLLLGSGWWAYARHLPYTCEILAHLAWHLPLFRSAGFTAIVPVLSIALRLVHRMYVDERRCLVKYAHHWLAHCNRVPYRLIPGVY